MNENGTAKGREKEKRVNVVKEERKGNLHKLKWVVNSSRDDGYTLAFRVDVLATRPLTGW